jgi:multiple sugar transport system ATP-binding protein
MVFQSYALYPHMTVRDNMGFSLKLKGTPKAQIAAEVERVADILQIQPLLDRLPKALSGGQRQRVAIGRAIVRNPKVFLFDEPLSNLDASLRVQMRIELTKLHKALKATMIYVTHDQVEAMTMADRIVVFNAGKIEQVGTPLELYLKPRNLFVATFLGSPKINLIQTQAVAASAPEHGWRIALPGAAAWTLDNKDASGLSGGEVTIGIRPEHVSLQPSDGAISVQAQFEVAEHLGDTQIGYFRVEGSPEPWSVKFAAGQTMPAYGAPVQLWMDRSHAHVFDQHGLAVH